MHIKSVQIENVRGFGAGKRRVVIDFTRPNGDLAGWTVVAGRNGAGKTTFVRALSLAIAGPTVGRSLLESLSGWIHGAHKVGSIKVTYQHHPADQFRGKGNRPATPIVAQLRLTRGSARDEPELIGSPAAKSKPDGPWRGPWSDSTVGWFVSGYGPFRRLSGHAVDAQRLMSAPGSRGRLVSLFREDASLVECIEWLRAIYLRALEEKPGAHKLLISVLKVLDDGLLPDGMSVEGVDSDGLRVKQGKTRLSLPQLSDGYRITAGLVLDITRQLAECYGALDVQKVGNRYQVMDAGVVIIDEMDVHLHVSWQQRIGFWLKEHFPNVQFIVTTHSPFICQAADPGGLIVLPAPGSSSVARHVTGDDFVRIVNGSADDAVMSELFGLDSTYSPRARAMRNELAELRAKQLRGTVTARDKKKMAALQGKLPQGPRHDVLTALKGLRAAEK